MTRLTQEQLRAVTTLSIVDLEAFGAMPKSLSAMFDAGYRTVHDLLGVKVEDLEYIERCGPIGARSVADAIRELITVASMGGSAIQNRMDRASAEVLWSKT